MHITHCTNTNTHTHKTQHNGAGVLKLRAQTPQIWYRIWHMTLKLSSMLLSSLGHQFISHSLDFTAIYQERMIRVRALRLLPNLSSIPVTSTPVTSIPDLSTPVHLLLLCLLLLCLLLIRLLPLPLLSVFSS